MRPEIQRLARQWREHYEARPLRYIRGADWFRHLATMAVLQHRSGWHLFSRAVRMPPVDLCPDRDGLQVTLLERAPRRLESFLPLSGGRVVLERPAAPYAEITHYVWRAKDHGGFQCSCHVFKALNPTNFDGDAATDSFQFDMCRHIAAAIYNDVFVPPRNRDISNGRPQEWCSLPLRSTAQPHEGWLDEDGYWQRDEV